MIMRLPPAAETGVLSVSFYFERPRLQTDSCYRDRLLLKPIH